VDYNKTAFAPLGCKIIAHDKPGNRCTWAPNGQNGYSLGPAMHQYRCQNVYISSTANEHTVELSSANRLIMAAKYMTDDFQNPHPEVPFAQIRDDTISALAELAAIFKLKLRQTQAATLPTAHLKVIQLPCLAESSNTLLASPMPLPLQKISRTKIHTQYITNAPLPPRVVTPRTLCPSPRRVPTRSQRLSPRNFSQHNFCGMDTSHMAITL
jgi:hypothetical protein